MSREVVIVDAIRSPVGRRNGALRETHALHLAAHSICGIFDRTGVDPAEVDQVTFGCVSQVGEQSINVGRQAWLHARLPIEVPSTTMDFQCGSSQQAIHMGAGQIMAGIADVVLAGGVEHMSRVPMFSNFKNGPGLPFTDIIYEDWGEFNQGVSAELIADKYGITREAADALGYESHQRAHKAQQAGVFENEILPINGVNKEGTPLHLGLDEGVRPSTTLEKMGELKTVFRAEGEGIVTAGNASQISDGSAAVLLMSAEKAEALGLTPRAKLTTFTVVGVDPRYMLEGPIPATRKILKQAGMSMSDIDIFEVNEAFASVVLAWEKELQPDMSKVNVHGGAMAIGHPLGCSGARLMTTLINALEQTDSTIGLQTMCCGGGMGTATIIERLN